MSSTTTQEVAAKITKDVVVAIITKDAISTTLAMQNVTAQATMNAVVTRDLVDVIETHDGANNVTKRFRITQVAVEVNPNKDALDRAIVTKDDVCTLFTINEVIAIDTANHIVATSNVIVAETTIELVVTLLAHDDIVEVGVAEGADTRSEVAVDQIVTATVILGSHKRAELLITRQRTIEQAMIAQQDVVASATKDGVIKRTTKDQVVA